MAENLRLSFMAELRGLHMGVQQTDLRAAENDKGSEEDENSLSLAKTIQVISFFVLIAGFSLVIKILIVSYYFYWFIGLQFSVDRTSFLSDKMYCSISYKCL